MKRRRAKSRALIGMISLAGLVASGCGQDAEVATTPDSSTTEARAPDPGTTGSTTESTAETPRTVPIEDDPPESTTGTGTPDGTGQDGTEPAVPIDLEPRLAFVSNMDHDPEIVVWNVDGSGERLLTDNFDDDRLPAWSPNGNRVAFVSDRAGNYDIYVVDADGSNPVRITDDDYRETRLAWSHDGTRIAYVRFTREGYYRADDFRYGDDLSDYSDEDFDIFVIDADGSNPVRVTHDDYREQAPVWSPDGSRIAYMRDTEPGQRGVLPEIIIVGSDGSDPFKLADGAVDPVWSPDGTRIAYNHRAHVQLAEADGSSTVQLVKGSGPTWSPDGTRIAYSRDGEIKVADADGTSARELTDTSLRPRGIANYWPSWSPDGTRIAYNHGGTGFKVYVMDADGTGRTPVTPNVGEQGSTPWSPDGRRIAYTVPRPLDTHIVVVDADGANPAALTRDDDGTFRERRNLCPDWSPDGLRIAFKSEAVLTFNDYELYVIDIAGTHATRLADNADFTGCPHWSPDGTRLAYHVNRGDNYEIWEIYAMDPDRRDIVRLTDSGAVPVWSPDGTQIAFISNRDGDWEIFVMDSDGSNETQLTFNNDNDWGPTWFPIPPE